MVYLLSFSGLPGTTAEQNTNYTGRGQVAGYKYGALGSTWNSLNTEHIGHQAEHGTALIQY